MTTSGLIPRNRLKWIPAKLRLAHEYCFHLHDEGARLLVEYEAARANVVTINFRSPAASARFAAIAEQVDTIEALRATGRLKQARRVILNQITMAMVSDFSHHLFEALKCLEKRKVVVALNLLRKPLTDSLVYLIWMLVDEDGFYKAFTMDGPQALSGQAVGNRRTALFESAVEQLELQGLVEASAVLGALFDAKNPHGLYRLFQRAVHLITIQRVEISTEPENFNFIFKRFDDDDVYHGIYEQLPEVMLLYFQVVLALFDRIKPMDKPAREAAWARSHMGLLVLRDDDGLENLGSEFERILSKPYACEHCSKPLVLTRHNMARTILGQTSRCTSCRRVSALPFSWLF